MFASIRGSVNWSFVGHYLVIGVVLCFVLGGGSLVAFFHLRSKRRFFTAFVLAAAVNGFLYTLVGACVSFTYKADPVVPDISPNVMLIVASVLACVAWFVFIGTATLISP